MSVVSARDENSKIVLTSYKGFADFGEILDETMIDITILCMMLHCGHVVHCRVGMTDFDHQSD